MRYDSMHNIHLCWWAVLLLSIFKFSAIYFCIYWHMKTYLLLALRIMFRFQFPFPHFCGMMVSYLSNTLATLRAIILMFYAQWYCKWISAMLILCQNNIWKCSFTSIKLTIVLVRLFSFCVFVTLAVQISFLGYLYSLLISPPYYSSSLVIPTWHLSIYTLLRRHPCGLLVTYGINSLATLRTLCHHSLFLCTVVF